MLKLLLDEHIAAAVARAVRRRHPSCAVCTLPEWHAGAFLGQSDDACLLTAAREHLTLVTYDRRTIPPLLKSWAEQSRSHGGVIFVDDRTVPPGSVGVLATALSQLVGATASWDWTDRIVVLHR